MPTIRILQWIVGVLAVLSLAGLAYVYVQTSQMQSAVPVQVENNNTNDSQHVLKETDPALLGNTSADNIDAYIATLDTALKEVPADSTEARLLMVRKAATLSLPRNVSFEGGGLFETFSIFYKLIFAPNTADDLPKRMAIVAFARMFDQWCFTARGIAPLTQRSPAMSALYAVYAPNYDNQQIKAMLAMSAFLHSYADDAVLSSDVIYWATSAKIDAVLLRSFHSRLRVEDREKLVEHLTEAVRALPGARHITFGQDGSKELSDKDLQFPVINDMYLSYTQRPLTTAAQAAIDTEYVKFFTKLDAYAGEDVITRDMFKSIASVYYVDSLKRRYGDTKNAEVTRVVNATLAIYAKNPTVRALMAAYFRDGVYGASTWETMKTNFMTLAQSNKELQAYFTSVGIKAEDVAVLRNDWSTWNK